jgi:hypothetical protein
MDAIDPLRQLISGGGHRRWGAEQEALAKRDLRGRSLRRGEVGHGHDERLTTGSPSMPSISERSSFTNAGRNFDGVEMVPAAN